MQSKNAETNSVPSHLIKRALRQRDYLLLGRFYRDAQTDEICQMTYYGKGEVVLLLETTYARDSREEIGCDLYRALSTSPNLTETIAAIP